MRSGQTTTYTFDAFERMTRAQDGTHDDAYTYDGLDRLAQRQGTTLMYPDLSNNATKVPNGTTTALISRGSGGTPIATKIGTAAAALTLADGRHDDILATADPAAGTLTASTSYDPWGIPTTSTGTLALGFQGGLTDPDTGQVNAHARWYDPGAGAFTSRDTWGQSVDTVAAPNLYQYAGGAPTNASDPTGHDPVYCTNPITGQVYVCGNTQTGGGGSGQGQGNSCDNKFTSIVEQCQEWPLPGQTQQPQQCVFKDPVMKTCPARNCIPWYDPIEFQKQMDEFTQWWCGQHPADCGQEGAQEGGQGGGTGANTPVAQCMINYMSIGGSVPAGCGYVPPVRGPGTTADIVDVSDVRGPTTYDPTNGIGLINYAKEASADDHKVNEADEDDEEQAAAQQQKQCNADDPLLKRLVRKVAEAARYAIEKGIKLSPRQLEVLKSLRGDEQAYRNLRRLFVTHRVHLATRGRLNELEEGEWIYRNGGRGNAAGPDFNHVESKNDVELTTTRQQEQAHRARTDERYNKCGYAFYKNPVPDDTPIPGKDDPIDVI